MTECCRRLKSEREFPSDEFILSLLSIRHLRDQTIEIFGSDAFKDLPVSDQRIVIHLRYLEQQLEECRSQQTDEVYERGKSQYLNPEFCLTICSPRTLQRPLPNGAPQHRSPRPRQPQRLPLPPPELRPHQLTNLLSRIRKILPRHPPRLPNQRIPPHLLRRMDANALRPHHPLQTLHSKRQPRKSTMGRQSRSRSCPTGPVSRESVLQNAESNDVQSPNATETRLLAVYENDHGHDAQLVSWPNTK